MATTTVPAKWDATQLPDLTGKTAIVTGANSGIGYVTALELAKHGAHVVLACRNPQRGQQAVTKMQQEVGAAGGKGTLEFMQLDTSSLKSVEEFANQFMGKHSQLHMLINNAGIMAVPHALTVDGFESQFATNHLGHFALTQRLFGVLKQSAPSRIVNVSSMAHKSASFDEEAIMTTADKYNPWTVYSNSKLSNLLFTFELDRRLKAAGVTNVLSVACHPGSTATNLISAPASNNSWMWRQTWKIAQCMPIFQTPEMGALPTLYAAAAPVVAGGDYFGPGAYTGWWGYPSLDRAAVAESTCETTTMAAPPAQWDASHMPDMKGKHAIVTGSNIGIGYVTALELCRRGAVVILACRSAARGKAAESSITDAMKDEATAGRAVFMQLDLSSLASVKAFASAYKKAYSRLDVLVNNAGVMAIPYEQSVDGHEMQFATNHLGHFALTSQLMDVLKKSAPARVVSVSSIAHRQANLKPTAESLMPKSATGYSPLQVYRDTKLCNILFAFDLDRRLRASGVEGVLSVVCHPGVTQSNLVTTSAAKSGWFGWLFWTLGSTQMGALPELYAATAPDVQGGGYYGPSGMLGLWGYPTLEEPWSDSRSEELARKLWEESEALAKVKFDV
ncbi:TPA: hypothetical protein N0F65_008062 [Lagenidium giganteum]|uniref:Uncharacterized protein n=1 Tax=Lagenidium giganteum TaxID=4803 RepID=A0AAV2YQL3_9STRA|nr:TPA: hypothetical protein N0F65_008062 [Lagenidium giganteum]